MNVAAVEMAPQIHSAALLALSVKDLQLDASP
jgi:hypothetical protein